MAAAVKQASSSLRELRVAEVIQQDATIAKDGSIETYRAKIESHSSYWKGTGLIRTPARDGLGSLRCGLFRHGSAPVLCTGAKSVPMSMPASLTDWALESSPNPWACNSDVSRRGGTKA